MPAHRAAATAGPLEAYFIARLGVGDIDLAALRIRHHVEEDRTDAGEEAGVPGQLCGWVAVGVDREHVLVGQREAHRVVPDAAAHARRAIDILRTDMGAVRSALAGAID